MMLFVKLDLEISAEQSKIYDLNPLPFAELHRSSPFFLKYVRYARFQTMLEWLGSFCFEHIIERAPTKC